MPRTPAHSPSFLDVRGSRTGRQHSDDGSGSDTVEDQLGLNHARAASRRASEAIIAADDDTQRELWDAMADDVIAATETCIEIGELVSAMRRGKPVVSNKSSLTYLFISCPCPT